MNLGTLIYVLLLYKMDCMTECGVLYTIDDEARFSCKAVMRVTHNIVRLSAQD